MFLYPNAKINIGLNIINKLKSGYHEIESCFCPVSLYDIIEVNTSDKDHLTTSGIDINSDISDNILIKWHIQVYQCLLVLEKELEKEMIYSEK